MKIYNIGISCIGSGVGQSVVNSLKHSRLPLRTIGLGTNPFAFGAYDCDSYDYTKSIYALDYIDDLLAKCVKHDIHLLIPGLDDETLIIAQNARKFELAGVKVICASFDFISLCRDKELMSKELNPIADVFVKCFQKETLLQEIAAGRASFPFIAKPRGGFASRGIEILIAESDLSKVNEEHIIQELAVPHAGDPHRESYLKQIKQNKNPQVAEISVQLVYSPDGKLLGRMASYNKLNNGVPIEVLPFDNDYVWGVIDSLTPYFLKLGLVGPVNIQGRLTDAGLKIFEINPRFTGITGLRALMGFNEVEACVKEWLGIDQGKSLLIFNHSIFGMRQTTDRAIPIVRNKEVVELAERLEQKGYKRKERVLITGASGYLGQNLVNKLIEENTYELWLFGRDKKKLEDLYLNKVDRLLDMEDYEMGRIPLGNVDVLLHLGFARPQKANHEIAESLKFTADLFTRAAMYNVPTIINMSSQSVYGTESMPLWSEEGSLPMPSTSYAQAKYGSEVLLENLKKMYKSLNATSIRLAGLTGGGPGYQADTDIISKLIDTAKNTGKIEVYSGNQKIDRLDIRDAVDALSVLLSNQNAIKHDVYNLSSGIQYRLIEIAEVIAKQYKINAPKAENITIEIMKTDREFPSFGLDVTRFTETFGWKSNISIEQTIHTIINK